MKKAELEGIEKRMKEMGLGEVGGLLKRLGVNGWPADGWVLVWCGLETLWG